MEPPAYTVQDLNVSSPNRHRHAPLPSVVTLRRSTNKGEEAVRKLPGSFLQRHHSPFITNLSCSLVIARSPDRQGEHYARKSKKCLLLLASRGGFFLTLARNNFA